MSSITKPLLQKAPLHWGVMDYSLTLAKEVVGLKRIKRLIFLLKRHGAQEKFLKLSVKIGEKKPQSFTPEVFMKK